MKKEKPAYRKNLALIITLIILISLSLIVALGISYRLTFKNIENEFSSKKIDVFEETVKPYNQLFLDKIPEISYYQGYLDSVLASKYIYTVLKKYQFVDKV